MMDIRSSSDSRNASRHNRNLSHGAKKPEIPKKTEGHTEAVYTGDILPPMQRFLADTSRGDTEGSIHPFEPGLSLQDAVTRTRDLGSIMLTAESDFDRRKEVGAKDDLSSEQLTSIIQSKASHHEELISELERGSLKRSQGRYDVGILGSLLVGGLVGLAAIPFSAPLALGALGAGLATSMTFMVKSSDDIAESKAASNMVEKHIAEADRYTQALEDLKGWVELVPRPMGD